MLYVGKSVERYVCDHIIKDIKSHSVLFRQQEALHGI